MLPLTLLHCWDAIGGKWIRVDYRDAAGTPQSACFAVMNWAGLMGGTRDLHRAILRHGPGGNLPMTHDEIEALESRAVRRRRRFWSAFAIAICTYLVICLGSVAIESYSPLAEGPAPATVPTDPGSLFVRRDVGKYAHSTNTYCYAPNSRFAGFLTITNTGLLPVTIYGDPPADEFYYLDFAQVDLAPYRDTFPADTPITSRQPTDPRIAPNAVAHDTRHRPIDRGLGALRDG